MKTGSENIINSINQLESRLLDFLKTFSGIEQVIQPGDNIFFTSGNNAFKKLDSEAISIQDIIYKDYIHLCSVIEVLLADSTSTLISEFNNQRKEIEQIITQNKMTWSESIQDVINEMSTSFNKIISIISDLFPKVSEMPMLVVDTNSLYYNDNIEDWSFSEFNSFEIIITPSVLKDLDKHKIEHRNEAIRKKAIKLINKLKEYRRRGKLIDGVVIKKDRITLKTIAKEPNFTRSLKWLDQSNDDDRLIAELLEVMKVNGGRSVVMITGDINLQNKCEFAELPCIDPPDFFNKKA
jgi:hypothetical protein